MAILKHISVKNRFYSSAVEYLTCQFDEYTNKPVLDAKGRMQERESYLIAGVNCGVDSFGAECIEVNRLYGKNNSVKVVKAHHYIISFEPNDPITMEQALEFGKQCIPMVTMAVRICTFIWLSIPLESMSESRVAGMISLVSGNKSG